MIKKTALLILDGWGIGNKPSSDAIYQANTPFFDMLWNNYPHSTLTTFGDVVDKSIVMIKKLLLLLFCINFSFC